MLTLLIPTYERPGHLLRLLRYFAAERVPWRVVVLDSSGPRTAAANKAAVAGVPLRAECVTLAPDTHPFDKFRIGFAMADTPYAVLCADDDVVMVEALRACAAHLDGHPDVVAAHGLYFNFIDERRLANPARHHGEAWYAVPPEARGVLVQNVPWHGPSHVQAAPAQRLAALLRRYEALTYAVYRTEVARTVFDLLRIPRGILFRELLGSGLTVLFGKVVRLRRFYCGRSTEPLTAYERWHPVDWLARSPQDLVLDYGNARHVLATALRAQDPGFGEAGALRLVDLGFLRYLSPYLGEGLLDALLDGAAAGLDTEALLAAGWAHGRTPEPAAEGGDLPQLPEAAALPQPGEAVDRRPGRDGAPVSIRFLTGFLNAGPAEEVHVGTAERTEIARCLAACLG
ncbi:MAG TPA: TIGR00180 family glycosyltransferase [Azospirillum sp.]